MVLQLLVGYWLDQIEYQRICPMVGGFTIIGWLLVGPNEVVDNGFNGGWFSNVLKFV